MSGAREDRAGGVAGCAGEDGEQESLDSWTRSHARRINETQGLPRSVTSSWPRGSSARSVICLSRSISSKETRGPGGVELVAK
jgi:hypothetical protein